jgi:hypothetical protein
MAQSIVCNIVPLGAQGSYPRVFRARQYNIQPTIYVSELSWDDLDRISIQKHVVFVVSGMLLTLQLSISGGWAGNDPEISDSEASTILSRFWSGI